MSSQPTPADELRAAATRIRALAENAPAAPWRLEWQNQELQLIDSAHSPNYPIAEWTYAVATWEPDASEQRAECDTSAPDYIAAMHPVVGLALADWLEYEAGRIERLHGHGAVTYAPAPALAVARALTPPRT